MGLPWHIPLDDELNHVVSKHGSGKVSSSTPLAHLTFLLTPPLANIAGVETNQVDLTVEVTNTKMYIDKVPPSSSTPPKTH